MLTNYLLSDLEFFNNFKDTPLNRIQCIGTHNSAAYQLLHGNNNIPSVKKLDYLRYIPVVGCIIASWTLTQNQNIIHQLNSGVKALDLRVMYDVTKQDFFFSHTLLCAQARDVLLQIRKYVDSSPMAFVMLFIKPDYEHRSTFTPAVNANFKALIRDVLGDKLVKVSPTIPTLIECLGNQTQVFCGFIDDFSVESDMWNAAHFNSGWIQSTDPEAFYNGVKSFIQNFQPNLFNMIPIMITPDATTITNAVKGEFLHCHKTNLATISLDQQPLYTRLLSDGVDISRINVWWLDYVTK
jgi:hypothetical protein